MKTVVEYQVLGVNHDGDAETNDAYLGVAGLSRARRAAVAVLGEYPAVAIERVVWRVPEPPYEWDARRTEDRLIQIAGDADALRAGFWMD